MIRWLHISDLHLGSDGATTAMLRDELPKFLNNERMRCDYVFCTGDIRTANANPNDFTDDMAVFLNDICKAVHAPTDRLFIVPGNHDVDRNVAGRAEAINNAMLTKGHYYNSDYGIIKPDDMAKIISGEHDLKVFLNKIYPSDRLNYFENAERPHFVIETDDFNLLHLDSTLSYTEGHEHNELMVGTNALYNVVRSLNKKKPTILLTHFPFSSLNADERKVISIMLQHNGVRLWLAGHEHDQVLQKEHYLFSLQAGELRKEKGIMPSFLIGEYDTDSFECKVSAYTWFPEGWTKYPYVDLDSTPKDVFCFKLTPAEYDGDNVEENKDEVNLSQMTSNATRLVNDLRKMVDNAQIEKVELDIRPENSVALSNNHIIERTELLERCETALGAGKIVIIHGQIKIGKTTLTNQIQERNHGVAVYDNVPSADLEGKIEILIKENRGGKSVVVSSSPLNPNMSSLDFSKIIQVEVPLMTLKETGLLIGTYQPTQDLTSFIWANSCGHPVLIKTLCGYLSSCGWSIDESNFSDVLNYTFDFNLSRSVATLISKLIPDLQSRAMFNRLLLVKGNFNEEVACSLAAVEPQINEPSMRLYDLIPSWVIAEGTTLKVSPLFDKVWKPDVTGVTYVDCNKFLANSVLRGNKALNERDVLNFIVYSMNAGEYDNAGAMYVTVLLKLHEGEGIPERSLLRGLWIDIPTPHKMSLFTRIEIRVIQLLLFLNLKKIQRRYLLNDLIQLVKQCSDKEYLPYFNSLITMFCWLDGDVKTGLEYYDKYLQTKTEGEEFFSIIEDAKPAFDNSIWIFLLQLNTLEDYIQWLTKFNSDEIEYSHDDTNVAQNCYLSVNRFVNKLLQKETQGTKLSALKTIQSQSESRRCAELAIVCIYKQMDLLTASKQYSEVREIYVREFEKYQEYPLATLLLNSAMGFACYRDSEVNNEASRQYFRQAIGVDNKELIPEIRLHILQSYSYVIAVENEEAAIPWLESALEYAESENHRVDLYEYYQCVGELSYSYWCVGKREIAVEMLSSCVTFVLDDLQGDDTSVFAKSFLCVCDCLIFKYQFDLKNKPLPDDQARPSHGMFTEMDLTSFDDLYHEDRHYTSCYPLSEICNQLGLKQLATMWAYRTVDACKNRKETQEMHYLLFLLLPLFIAENDIETIRYVITHSCEAKKLTHQNNPSLNKENADLEFVEFFIAPLLMGSLSMLMRENESGLQLVKQVINDYVPISDPEAYEQVKFVFNNENYDRGFIGEINKLDKTRYYSVYLCAYIMTAFHTDAYYAFTLLIAVLPRLEQQLIMILGDGVLPIITHFIVDFWKAKILNSPDEFSDYQRLFDKGLHLINEYEGKENQGNHIMFIVSHHLKGDLSLNSEQEAWLDKQV